jgi:thiol-disulfide isomerase/thioredoxin
MKILISALMLLISLSFVHADEKPLKTSKLELKIITASWCGYCKQLINNLKDGNKEMEDLEIEFTDRRLDVVINVFEDDNGTMLMGNGFPEIQVWNGRQFLLYKPSYLMSAGKNTIPKRREIEHFLEKNLIVKP